MGRVVVILIKHLMKWNDHEVILLEEIQQRQSIQIVRRPVEGLGQGEPSQTADDNEEGLYLLDFNITKMELSPEFIQEF